MFGKVIVFGLFEMIQKKKKKVKKKMSEVRVLESGFGLRVRLGTVARVVTFLMVLEPRFRKFYKMIF